MVDASDLKSAFCGFDSHLPHFHGSNSIGRVSVFQTGCCGFDPRLPYFRGLAEWPIAAVLKTARCNSLIRSNRIPSTLDWGV